MIRQQVGDLLEIEYQGRFFYLVVLTRIVLFGGNIVYAFHTRGRRMPLEEVMAVGSGFNVCTDLLLPKREGKVTRLHRFEDVSRFWMSPYAKLTNEYRPGHKAKEWFIYRIDDPATHIERRRRMPRRYRRAMDYQMAAFDLVAEKILEGYTPEQNPFL